eukprot:CAMPEP_0178998684 /NCGR_PEP_ID=MMETSP0795-20121207/9643_1 /TAXON_ID=88552 /ORGANISM="Amoebophrya sp., Strain Ameob2" /LENGTH=435 /DNA_ID=CAMNT_0020691377 /DNA_START=420 /DNA_END=1727 /DNA_ORIENTATION=+
MAAHLQEARGLGMASGDTFFGGLHGDTTSIRKMQPLLPLPILGSLPGGGTEASSSRDARGSFGGLGDNAVGAAGAFDLGPRSSSPKSMTLLGLLSPTVLSPERGMEPSASLTKKKFKGRFQRSKRANMLACSASPSSRRSPPGGGGHRSAQLSPASRASPKPASGFQLVERIVEGSNLASHPVQPGQAANATSSSPSASPKRSQSPQSAGNNSAPSYEPSVTSSAAQSNGKKSSASTAHPQYGALKCLPCPASSSSSTSRLRPQLLRVDGQRCTIFDRPKRSEVRKYAVWNLYSGRNMLGWLPEGMLGEDGEYADGGYVEGMDALDERLIELMYRDITPEDYDTLLELDDSNQKKTAERSALDKLPCITCFDGYSEEQLTCGVCYMRVDEDQEEVERIFQMPCRGKHIFHEACVTKWLLECKAACPTCHEPIEEE